MANTIQRIDAATLFAGDEDPTNSLHLQIKNVGVILDLEEETENHKAGGHVLGIDLGNRFFSIAPFTFSLAGVNMGILTKFMPSKRIKYTVRANIRDYRKDEDVSMVAIIEGRMVSVKHKPFGKGEAVDGDYEIKEIMQYELYMGGEEILYFQYFAGVGGLRRMGQPMHPELQRNLGLV